MSKGTPARGKMHKTLHITCRRCGKKSFHKKTGICSSCGYGKSPKRRSYNWQTRRGVNDKNKI